MGHDPADRDVAALTAVAARLDSLADVADLMGDAAGAERLRADASARRLQAMAVLDG
jgi:hypothetical protein